jgi:sulfur-oxidizing protein SoxY
VHIDAACVKLQPDSSRTYNRCNKMRKCLMTVTALFRSLTFAAIAALALGTPCMAQEQSEATWNSIKPNIFGDAAIVEDDAVLALDTPVRAEDAAIVPIGITAKFPQNTARSIKAITLIIDENPAPVAGKFTFGPAAPDASFSTRVRINAYSFVRAVAELNDGTLHMVKRFVKASGGCSAPAGKDMDAAAAELGKMKLRQFPVVQQAGIAPDELIREAQIMVRHPNNSGMQMNQVTMLYIPARYVRDLSVSRGADLVFRMEGGISISEDPNFRFHFKGTAGEISVNAKDTEDKAFDQKWTIEAPGT